MFYKLSAKVHIFVYIDKYFYNIYYISFLMSIIFVNNLVM